MQKPSVSEPSLLVLSSKTRQISQKFVSIRTWLQITSATSLSAALFLAYPGSSIVATAGLILQIGAMAIASHARSIHELSREAQRRALLQDALGVTSEVFDEIELRRAIGSKVKHYSVENLTVPDPYYSSRKKSGPERFKENLQESVFYTRDLLNAEFALMLGGAISSGLFLLVVGLIILMSELITDKITAGAAILTMTLLTIETSMTALSARRASQLLHSVDRRLEHSDAASLSSLLATFADYAVATAIAPPLSTKRYKKRRDELNGLWEKRSRKFESSAEEDVDLVVDATGDFAAVVKSCLSKKLSAPEKELEIKMAPMPEGHSGARIFKLDVMRNGRKALTLVGKQHQEAVTARDDLKRALMIGGRGFDCFARVAFDNLIDNTVFYYHGEHETQEVMQPLGEILKSARATAELPKITRSMQAGLTKLVTIFSSEGEAKVASAEKYRKLLLDYWPPRHFMDIRGCFVRQEGPLIFIHESSRTTASDREATRLAGNVHSMLNRDGGIIEAEMRSQENSCLLIFNRAQIPSECLAGQIEVCLMGKVASNYRSYEKRLADLGLGFNEQDFVADIDRVIDSTKGKAKLVLMQHRDLHAGNCLVGKDGFKAIDYSGFGYDLCTTDEARLENSLVSGLIEHGLLDIRTYIEWLEGKHDGPEVSEGLDLIRSCRRAFRDTGEFRCDDQMIAVSYYREILFQINTLFDGGAQMQPGLAERLAYWHKKVFA